MIDRERVWSLGPDALHWKSEKREGHIPYADIRKMRLIAYANTGGEQYQCAVSTLRQGKIKIRSHHYVSLGNFEDRTATYAPFIRALLDRVAAASPQAAFRAGGLGYQIMWISVFVLDVSVLVLMGLALLGSADVSLNIMAVLAGMVLILPFIWRQIGRNRGHRFDPAAPPGELIGE